MPQPMPNPPFCLCHTGDGYSTDGKIMGRQVAGKSLLRGIARTWPDAAVNVICESRTALTALDAQMRTKGFRGQIRCSLPPDWDMAVESGCLYYPAPPDPDIAASRERIGPAAFSLIGITHSLSSKAALDRVSALLLPPFRPWDALICTSQAAHGLVTALLAEGREFWARTIGATRFNQPVLPVIPLGIDAPALAACQADRPAARAALGLAEDEVAILSAGRMAMHAKSNPAAFYMALERLAQSRPIVCIEAGIPANAAVPAVFAKARAALAPSVRFIAVDGAVEARYAAAWQAADIFVSLPDNIQETFGLTPLEAMARGLPVIVSDWDGYKDTVRHGIDGLRVPTFVPPADTGSRIQADYLAADHGYDMYVGRASLATVVAVDALHQALARLMADPALRRRMGAAGQQRAQQDYDWPCILARYADLAGQLRGLRQAAGSPAPLHPPSHQDPFHRFGPFATARLQADWRVTLAPDAAARLPLLQGLGVANYAFDDRHFSGPVAERLLRAVPVDGIGVQALLQDQGLVTPLGLSMIMWLWKFDLVRISPT